MSILIAEEGYRQRASQDVTGWFCGHCNKSVTFAPGGVCPTCKRAGALHTIVSKDKYHAQTEAIKQEKAVKAFSPGFEPWKLESQMGRPLFPNQLKTLLQKHLSGLVMREAWNDSLKRKLNAFYVPYQWKAEDLEHISAIERKSNLKFICCCEATIMPEWDVILKDKEGKPTNHIRGWRSVLGIFYRMKLIPWMPDDGRRLAAWQIRQSPFTKEN